MNDRISIHPKICHGQACIRGTRIPVHQIARMLANGDSIDTLLGEYASITREDIHACLEYAASLAEKVAVLDAESYIHERAARGSRGKFERVLSKVPDVEPEEHDRLSPPDAD